MVQSPFAFYIGLKKWILPLVVLLFVFPGLPAQAQNAHFKIFLIGDAGEDAQPGKALLNLQRQLEQNPNSAVIFLGDNSYKDALGGLIHFGFKGFDSGSLTQQKVRAQLDRLANYYGHAFFVPGNHDWWNNVHLPESSKKLLKEQSFIEKNLSQNTPIANPGNVFLPANGAPGPEFMDLDSHSVRIVFIDTYRMILETYKKTPKGESTVEQQFYGRLDSLIKDGREKHLQVIVAGHHVLYAKGPNTGPLKHPKWFQRIKTSNSNYPATQRMIAHAREILARYPGTYYVCGHIHSLQYYYGADSIHYIVSGAGSKTAYVSAKDAAAITRDNDHEYTLWNEKGFFEMEFTPGDIKLYVYDESGTKKLLPQ